MAENWWKCRCGQLYLEVPFEELDTYPDPGVLRTCRRCGASSETFKAATATDIACQRANPALGCTRYVTTKELLKLLEK